MAQKTNLNINPYYDDFDGDKNFYKVLFKPGFPVQSRELTTLQSILQNQIESFGDHFFKEGSMVLPGAVTYDDQFSAVKIEDFTSGVDVSVYIKNFIGKRVTGQISGVSAVIKEVALTTDSDLVTNLTIYVKYSRAGDDNSTDEFLDGESLFADEDVVYGNTTINSGTTFCSLISNNATSTGSAASVDEGVYFIRGYFVDVPKQTLILDYYTNTPSYRVGFIIDELIINAKDDESLYDNAKGFTNFAAPGADRFKISLKLSKKPLTDNKDTNFVEILRVDEGRIKKVEDKTVYSVIGKEFARRTFDESGNYAVDEFNISVSECLNDRIDNDGVFLENETTDDGNTPTDELLCYQVSPGRAYVLGYESQLDDTQTIDVRKPRDTETIDFTNIPFEMGNLLRVNNVSGLPEENIEIDLKDKFKGNSPSNIGKARVYTFNLTDSKYKGNSTKFDLYLYDIQTYTQITLYKSLNLNESFYIKGKSSGASGFVVADSADSQFKIRQTSGTFIADEQLIVNGSEVSAKVKSTIVYGIDDIKSVAQSATSGFPGFSADAVLSTKKFSSGITEVTVSGTSATAPGKLFSGVNIGDILSVNDGGTRKFNRISGISDDLSTLTLEGTTGVVNGTQISAGTYNAKLKVTRLRNSENASLYVKIPDNNISSVNLSNSQLLISNQSTLTINNEIVTLNQSNTGISSSLFESFDQERYTVSYSNGGIGTITSDKFTLGSGGSTVTISGLNAGGGASVINTTLKKVGIQSKVKEYTRSTVGIVSFSSKTESGIVAGQTINDGLLYNQYYGRRVQDEEISLDYPDVVKVLKVLESTGKNDPILTRVQFESISSVDQNAIIGEDLIGQESGALARVVQNSSSNAELPISTNNLGIVYLNDQQFEVGELVTFRDSNINSTVQSITLGKFKDITNNFTLNTGQKDEYYDYSRIVRVSGNKPERKILVVFDHFTVPSNDTGDVFTVLSYDADRYSQDIPLIGESLVRASDVLDFRPRVSQFTSTDRSPFDFNARSFDNGIQHVLKPGESSSLGYNFYLPRIDKIYLDKFSQVIVEEGVSSLDPKPPSTTNNELMELGEISLPAYLFNTADADISLRDNRRYTMRDIGTLEDRIEALEEVTSLNLLEVSTEALNILDVEGNNRFKSGFFVDPFEDASIADAQFTNAEISNGELGPRRFSNSVSLVPLPKEEVPEDELDLQSNYDLLDDNVQKTGNMITLKYESKDWIEQPLATRVENVNPFHVIEYVGFIKLSPPSDTWTRTVRLPTRVINRNNLRVRRRNRTIDRERGRVDSRRTRTTRNDRIERSTTRRTVIVSSGSEKYIRSRNVKFKAIGLRPLQQHYQFVDNHSNIEYVPKLIEIANSSTLENSGSSKNSFKTGELVRAYFDNRLIGEFRLAKSNHKSGPYTNPDKTYNINPYKTTENLPSNYSQSSKTLNVDLDSLANIAQEQFTGYIKKGAKLIGSSSGAIAFVKNKRLIPDNYGNLQGSFFIKDPHTNPAPNNRLTTGVKTYRLTSSKENKKPLPGSKLISKGDTQYRATGRFIILQREIINTTTRITTITRTTTVRRSDPLAQSFAVGRDIEAPDSSGFNDDDKGAFLTAVDIFFGNKPSGSEPLIVQIRRMAVGLPTLEIIGDSVELEPDDIKVSNNGEKATTVTFPSPIFLPPGEEYALVLLAPTTDQYEVWTAKMGEKTVNTQSLPDAESVRYTKQFALGSLFKSQNGSTWTPAQKSDLKFKLYKAKFDPNSPGVASFGNSPILSDKDTDISVLTVPKTTTLGVDKITSSTLVGILTTGRKIAGILTNTFGHISDVGGETSSVGLTTGGTNYVTDSNVSTFNILGNGSGLILNITASDGVITGTPSIVNAGGGYRSGDVVGIVTSTVTGANGTGAVITITAIDGVDTLYLTNVQGQVGADKAFRVGAALSYYSDETTIVSLGGTNIISSRTAEGTGTNSGNYLQVDHFNHGMYALNNKLKLNNIESDQTPSVLTKELTFEDTTSIEVEDSSLFSTFEGLPVSTSNKGYVKVNDEIIEYYEVVSGKLTINARGIDDTNVDTHENGASIVKYELSGISLRRINNVSYDIADEDLESNSYYIEVDRGATSTVEGKSIGVNRSSDIVGPGVELSFEDFSVGINNDISGTRNVLFNEINPAVDAITTGKGTEIKSSIRSTSGTSISGSETSFTLLNTIDSIELNTNNVLNTTRMVCSRENELRQNVFENVSGRRSLTALISLSTDDKNLSPYILLNDEGSITANLISNQINAPVNDFANNGDVNTFDFDPHEAIYVSNSVSLENPASSLQVLLTAQRPPESDIRVLYSLVREDSSGQEQEFELFPGFSNLELGADGALNVINPSQNDGSSDARIPDSDVGQYLEYQFTANDLPSFVGYRIKIILSGSNQATPPKVRDLRAIALQ